VVSYGWRYDPARGALARVEPIPAFLHDLRARAAAFAGRPAEALEPDGVRSIRSEP